MTLFKASLRGVVAAMAIGAASAAAQQSTPLSEAQQGAIRALILETIRDNPRAIIDAVRAYQEQAAAEQEDRRRATVAALRDALLSDPNAASLGNPDGDTVIVEFYDYNCPYCRRAAPELSALIAEDRDVRVVMREWPILGPDSEAAARASLAAFALGEFAAFHDALMAQPRANAVTIRRAADAAGLDFERLEAAMRAPEVDAHIARSHEIARRLGITGTPTFIVGDDIVPGFVEKAQLAAMIAEARDAAGKK